MEVGTVLVIFSIFLLTVLAFAPDLGLAAEVWSDDFEDGNLDGWTENLNCIVSGGRMKGSQAHAEIQRASTTTSGTWSFDLHDVGEFATTAYYLTVVFKGSDPDVYPHEYYALKIIHTSAGDNLRYVYYLDKKVEGLETHLASYDGLLADDLRGTLHQISISRTEVGEMVVRLNGTAILESTDADVTTSEYFFIVFDYDWAIDNILVDDVPTPAGIPLIFLVVGGAGVVVVLLVVLVFLKRR